MDGTSPQSLLPRETASYGEAVHPILFKLPFGGGFPVYSYGVMLGLSFVVGWYLTLGLAKRDGLPREPLANCYVLTAVAAVVGARLLYVATNPADFDSLGKVFEFRSGGMVAYGGFLGGFVGSFAYLRWKGLPLIPWADVAVPSLASGLLITRIGCYLFGCDFGRPLQADAPRWLQRLGEFPRWPDDVLNGAGSPAFYQHVDGLGLDPTATHSLPVHPTQLYEAATGLGLLVVLLLLRRRQLFRGQLFLSFTFLYGVARFLLEFLRDDAERGEVPPNLPGQWLYSLAFLAFGLAFAFGLARLAKPGPTRLGLQALGLIPAVYYFLSHQPEPFATVAKVSLSTSQSVGLLTAVGAMLAFGLFHKAALANPRSAMALPDFAQFEEPEIPAAGAPARADEKDVASSEPVEDAEAEEVASDRPELEAAPKRRTKRKKKRSLD